MQFVVVFALGGLQSMFIAPTVFGLFWKRATKWGAIASMYLGLVSYLVLEIIFPDLFGDIVNLVPALTLSIVAMVVVSLLTPSSQEILRLFWGRACPRRGKRLPFRDERKGGDTIPADRPRENGAEHREDGRYR